jgi:hypothetical protein
MRPFPSSKWNEYILIAVNYVSKWVEVVVCQRADANTVKYLFNDLIFF